MPPEKQDGRLSEKLEAELSGILNWAIRGAIDWYCNGLMPPQEVRAATEAYRMEMDVFSSFIDDAIKPAKGRRVSKTELYGAYCRWVGNEGSEALTKTAFGDRLKQRGFDEGRSRSERYWKDITINVGYCFNI